MDIVTQFKKGWRTSEFWVMVVTTLAPLIALFSGWEVDVEEVVGLIGVIFGGATYVTNRTFLKRKRIEGVAAAVITTNVDGKPTPVEIIDGVGPAHDPNDV